MAEPDLLPERVERDELVDSLKNALVQRDLRIGQLELMLSRALVSPNGQVPPELERSLLPPPPPPASHRLSPHISAETKGLYPDGWTSPSAQLVFHPGADSGHYQISFWLPGDAEAKPLMLDNTFGEQVQLDLLPGKNVTYTLPVPADGLSPATLKLETEKIGPKGQDRRDLGVVVARVYWADSSNER